MFIEGCCPSYASETYRLSQKEEKKSSFENMCPSRLLGVPWTHKIANGNTRNIIGQSSLIKTIWKRRWSYLGYVMRKSYSRVPKWLLFSQVRVAKTFGYSKTTTAKTDLKIHSNFRKITTYDMFNPLYNRSMTHRNNHFGRLWRYGHLWKHKRIHSLK